MWFLCWIGLHSWEDKTRIEEKPWYVVTFVPPKGYNEKPFHVQKITVHYKECRSCGTTRLR